MRCFSMMGTAARLGCSKKGIPSFKYAILERSQLRQTEEVRIYQVVIMVTQNCIILIFINPSVCDTPINTSID